jgi:hypothetical protein
VAVEPHAIEEVEELFRSRGMKLDPFGTLVPKEKYAVTISD